MEYITKTSTEFIWIPLGSLEQVKTFIRRKFPKVKFEGTGHSDKKYLKFKDHKTAVKIQQALVKEGYFKFLKK